MFGRKPKAVEPKFEYTLLMTNHKVIVIVAESLPWQHPSIYNKISEILSVRNAK